MRGVAEKIRTRVQIREVSLSPEQNFPVACSLEGAIAISTNLELV